MRLIYCDHCGEPVNGKNAVVYKNTFEEIEGIFCDDDCLNDFLVNRIKEVYITEKGVVDYEGFGEFNC